jgi:mercuric reductase
VDWIDHISALELTELPRSLLVVGAGAVGLEFGQIFRRFGSEVTIVDALERISPNSDSEASAMLDAALREEGIEIATSVFVKSVRSDGDEIVATIAPRDGSAEYEARAERIMLASGRVPNIDELSLEAAGIETGRAGIETDDRMRTAATGIWAAGDVVAGPQFTPVAQYQARVAVADMFGANGAAADYSYLPTSIFTDPELGGVGLTEDQARKEGYEVEVVRNEYVKRFSYIDLRHGLFKIVFDRGTRKVLGVHIVARGASDIIQAFGVSMRLGVTVDDLITSHHAFPTYAEGLKAAAEQARSEVAAR